MNQKNNDLIKEYSEKLMKDYEKTKDKNMPQGYSGSLTDAEIKKYGDFFGDDIRPMDVAARLLNETDEMKEKILSYFFTASPKFATEIINAEMKLRLK